MLSDLTFPILGTEIPPMIGRDGIMQRMWSDLTKKTPSHLSVVGARFAGKSVLLKALELKMRSIKSPYCTTIRWDLGHQTPISDGEFMQFLCRQIGEGLKEAGNEYGDHLLSVYENHYCEICEVMDALYDEDRKVLMLWDGFDKPLTSGVLTRNLWDNLLALCSKPSFRLVTSTRRELHHLIRDEKSVTSDFWGIFERKVHIGVFDNTDINTILSKLPNHQFQSGARTELLNWTGGYPPLVCELLNQIHMEYEYGDIDNGMVNEAGTRTVERASSILSSLWNDCHERAKDLYIDLAGCQELAIADTGNEERAVLVEKGFANESGGKIRFTCRFLHEYIKGASLNTGTMARLFGNWEAYRSNIGSIMKRRLEQISQFDDRLYRYVELSFNHLPNDPELALNNLTSIEERAFDRIWQREFGESKVMPDEILDYWEQVNPTEKIVLRLHDISGNTVPGDRGLQCGILQLLTGSKAGFEKKARFTSKNTYVLINTIHSFRNLSQHLDGEELHLGVAVSGLMLCLELFASLERDLAS